MTRRALILHPFFIATYPALFLVTFVYDDLDPTQSFRTFGVSIVVTALLLGAVYKFIKDWHRAGLVLSLFLVFFVYYPGVYYLGAQVLKGPLAPARHLFALGVWAWGMFVGGRWIFYRARNHQRLTLFLNIAGGLTTLILLARLPPHWLEAANPALTDWAHKIPELDAPAPAPPATLPDIYYIIVDGYGRQDVLRDLYQLDNTPFIDFLQARGFYVASASQSNYAQTVLSLSSSLNFQYLDALAQQLGEQSSHRNPMLTLIRDSNARRFLAQQGYQMVNINSGFKFTIIPDAEVFLPPPAKPFNLFESQLMHGSVTLVFGDTELTDQLFSANYQTQREVTHHVFEQLAQMPQRPGPKFVFAHVVAPHPPFVFDQHGEAINPDYSYSMREGNYYVGGIAEYLRGYRAQALYINTLLEETIDTLLTQSATPPIIILQGDHGPGALLNWEAAEDSCLTERLSILNAYYLPGQTPTEVVYPSITPVNSFPAIFNAYFGTQFALQADHSYFSAWSQPYQFIDAAAQISAEHCLTVPPQ